MAKICAALKGKSTSDIYWQVIFANGLWKVQHHGSLWMAQVVPTHMAKHASGQMLWPIVMRRINVGWSGSHVYVRHALTPATSGYGPARAGAVTGPVHDHAFYLYVLVAPGKLDAAECDFVHDWNELNVPSVPIKNAMKGLGYMEDQHDLDSNTPHRIGWGGHGRAVGVSIFGGPVVIGEDVQPVSIGPKVMPLPRPSLVPPVSIGPRIVPLPAPLPVRPVSIGPQIVSTCRPCGVAPVSQPGRGQFVPPLIGPGGEAPPWLASGVAPIRQQQVPFAPQIQIRPMAPREPMVGPGGETPRQYLPQPNLNLRFPQPTRAQVRPTQTAPMYAASSPARPQPPRRLIPTRVDFTIPITKFAPGVIPVNAKPIQYAGFGSPDGLIGYG